MYLFAIFAMAFKVLALPRECVDSNPHHLLSFIQQGIALLCLLAYCLLVGAMYGRNAQTEEYSLDQFAQVPMIDIISEDNTYEYTHLSMATGAHHGGTDQHGGVLRSAAGAGRGIDKFGSWNPNTDPLMLSGGRRVTTRERSRRSTSFSLAPLL